MFKIIHMILFCFISLGGTVSHGAEELEKSGFDGLDVSSSSNPIVRKRVSASTKETKALIDEKEESSDKESKQDIKLTSRHKRQTQDKKGFEGLDVSVSGVGHPIVRHRVNSSTKETKVLMDEKDEFSDKESKQDVKVLLRHQRQTQDVRMPSPSHDPHAYAIRELLEKVEKLEQDNVSLRSQVISIERNIGSMSGNQTPYYRFMRADLVIQLTLISTFFYTLLTVASGGSVSDTAMAILSMYMFYGFFKCVRDVGTYAGNLNFKRAG